MARRKRRQWGNGSVRERSPGRWQVRWVENGQRRAEGGFPTRDDAERVLAKILGEAAQGRTHLPLNPRDVPTLETFAAPWLDARERTHRAADCDRYRWKKHLSPHFGHLRPAQVDAGAVRVFVQAKLAEGLSSGTVRILVALLSSLFAELVEDGKATSNPARELPRATRRLVKPSHDPRTTPFIEKLDDVRRIYLELPEPLNVAYALGAFAGLRTGEVFGLKWEHVDLPARRIHVRESISGPLKDGDSRVVPILDTLQPVLSKWKLRAGTEARVIPPMRRDGQHINKGTPGKYLRAALKALGLQREGLGWYEATRHSFASHWVLGGGSIEKLKELLGHYSVVMTERYAHLRVDLFADRDRGALAIDLRPGTVETAPVGANSGTEAPAASRKAR